MVRSKISNCTLQYKISNVSLALFFFYTKDTSFLYELVRQCYKFAFFTVMSQYIRTGRFWEHWNIDLCFSFPFKIPKKWFLRFKEENKTLEVLRFGPQRAVITTVFLTLWLTGQLGCVYGRNSLNNGMRTGVNFFALLPSHSTCVSRFPRLSLCVPKIHKKLRLFYRLDHSVLTVTGYI